MTQNGCNVWVGCLRVELHAAASIYLRAQIISIVCCLCVSIYSLADRHKNVQRSVAKHGDRQEFSSYSSIDDEQINNDAREVQLVRQQLSTVSPFPLIDSRRLSHRQQKARAPSAENGFSLSNFYRDRQTDTPGQKMHARYIIMNSKHEIMAFDLARFFFFFFWRRANIANAKHAGQH